MEMLEILKTIVEFLCLVCIMAMIIVMFMGSVLHMQTQHLRRKFANINSKKGPSA